MSPSLLSDVPFVALSVRQPWAWLLFHGKDVENRDWYTARRGPLAIHSSAGMTREEYAAAVLFVRGFDPALADRIPAAKELVLGAVLGLVDQVGCVRTSDSPWFCGALGHLYERPRLLVEAIPARGKLGLWKWFPPAEGLRYA